MTNITDLHAAYMSSLKKTDETLIKLEERRRELMSQREQLVGAITATQKLASMTIEAAKTAKESTPKETASKESTTKEAAPAKEEAKPKAKAKGKTKTKGKKKK